MLKLKRSSHSVKTSFHQDKVYLICQFFIHPNKKRNDEIKDTLRRNCENEFIDHIILLNERLYSDDELGIYSDKIEQINVGKRLVFSDIFSNIEYLNLKGYIVVSNADIFFDKSLQNIKWSGIHKEKKLYAQLRFEYTNKNLSKCKIFGPRSDSQDVWIFHSDYNIPKEYRAQFKIQFGISNCDLKFTYLFNLLDFDIINDPYFIKCYHNHRCNIRDYLNKPEIPRPLMFVIPFLNPKQDYEIFPMGMWCKKSGMTYYDYLDDEKNFIDEKDMNNLSSLLKYSFESNRKFSVSFTNIHNYNLYHLFNKYIKLIKNEEEHEANVTISQMNSTLTFLKNKGLEMKNTKQLNLYVNKLKENIGNSQINIHIPPGHGEYLSILNNKNKYGIQSGAKIFKELLEFGKKYKKIPIGLNVLNIGAHMFKQGWFDMISNKKILIISKHFLKIKKQIEMQKKNNIHFYKRSIFKDCEFDYLDIPIRKGKNQEYIDIVNEYVQNLGEKLNKNNFDIVFIGDTVYDFFIANFVKTVGCSVMVGGKFVPLWFGLYSKEDLQENKDVVKMFMNAHWNMI